jgi:hypothetical protein
VRILSTGAEIVADVVGGLVGIMKEGGQREVANLVGELVDMKRPNCGRAGIRGRIAVVVLRSGIGN